jgi:hypothetical protein
MLLQGIRMSSFLETNTEPGQKKLSTFLRQDPAKQPQAPPRNPHGWNQTFLPREVRDSIHEEMERCKAARSGTEAPPDGAAALVAPLHEQVSC